MRPVKSIACCVGLLLALAGCSALPTPGRDDRGQEAEKQPAKLDPSKVERIEISACVAPGIPSPSPVPHSEVVLERAGRCRGTVVVDGKATAVYDLPVELFDECRGLLAEVDFFRMRSSSPEVPFENSSSSLCVRCGRKEHSVSVLHPAPSPPGFDRVWNFVMGLEKRGKHVKTEDARSPDTPNPS
jgi:hypothetical protein